MFCSTGTWLCRLTPLLWIAVLLVLLFGVSGCSVNPVSGDQDFVLVSEEQEIAMGRKAHAEILKQYGGAYDNPELAAYVQRIGETLAAQSHRDELIYRFTVLDSTDVNAFALPGGYIYITRGLLAYLGSEAELAAVLGHEIGHVTARHGVRQQSVEVLTDVLAQIGAQFLPPGVDNAVTGQVIGTLQTALVRGYGREHELESDRLGAEYLARTGYDPEAMLGVLRVLKAQEEYDAALAEREGRETQSYHGLFSTHPDNDRRLREVIGPASALQKNLGVAPRSGVVQYLRALEGVTFGDSAEQGVVRGHRFYHAELDLSLEFPQGWRIENRVDRVLAKAPDGKGDLQLTVQDRNKRIDPATFVTTRLKLKTSDGEDWRTPDAQGHTARATIKVDGERREGWVSVVYLDQGRSERAYVLLGASDPASPEQYTEALTQTPQSLRRLTREEDSLARGLRLTLYEAQPGDRWESLAARNGLATADELQLMNQRWPDGEVEPGRLLKLVE
jgi:predicted Zn-dependent protease